MIFLKVMFFIFLLSIVDCKSHHSHHSDRQESLTLTTDITTSVGNGVDPLLDRVLMLVQELVETIRHALGGVIILQPLLIPINGLLGSLVISVNGLVNQLRLQQTIDGVGASVDNIVKILNNILGLLGSLNVPILLDLTGNLGKTVGVLTVTVKGLVAQITTLLGRVQIILTKQD